MRGDDGDGWLLGIPIRSSRRRQSSTAAEKVARPGAPERAGSPLVGSVGVLTERPAAEGSTWPRHGK